MSINNVGNGGGGAPVQPPPPPPPPPQPQSAAPSAASVARAAQSPTTTVAQRQFQQDSFQPARQAPQTTQPQQRQRFQVAMSPENRAHLARQGGEISQKWDQFTGWAERTGNWFQRNVPGVQQLNNLGAAAGDLAGEWGMRGAQAVGADQWKVPDRVLDAADAVTRPVLQNQGLMDSMMTRERFTYGAGMQAVGTVEGLHTLATNPGEVASGLKNAALHPVQTGQAIGDAIQKEWNKDPVEFAGRAAFEVASALLPASKASGAAKAGEVAEHVGQAARVANGVEDAARVANAASDAARVAGGVDDAARAANAAGDAARVAGGAERAAAGTAGHLDDATRAATPLRQGTAEFNDLARQTTAKEDLARRLRGTLDGRNELPPGSRGHAMSGATPDMTPDQLRAQINKLETEASVNRSKMAMAEPPARPSTAELTEAATQDMSKLTDAEFTQRALGYPEDLSQKFKPAEIESMRVYLGNEVRGDPVNIVERFIQSDLHDGLDDLAEGFTNAAGEAVPPGEVTRLNFKHINGHLRGTRTDLTPGQIDRVKDVVGQMDTAMEKSVLKEPVTVYRVNEAQFTRPGADGLIPADRAFQSTARSPQLGFATDDPSKYTLQIIELQPGQKAFDMDALTRFQGDIDSFRGRMPAGVPKKTPFGEQELLLPRGTQFRVTDSYVDPVSGFNVQRVRVAN